MTGSGNQPRKCGSPSAEEIDMNATAQTDHEQGYRAAACGLFAKEVEDHFSGVAALDKSDQWFFGYQDHLDDISMGNGLMYGLRRGAQVSA